MNNENIKLTNKKPPQLNEMAFVASTGARTGIAIRNSSIADIKFLSMASKNSSMTVEIGGIEPPRTRMAIPASQPAIPTAVLLYHKSFDDKIDYDSGQIDDVRVYNYALTAAQVRDVYGQGAVRFGQ